MFGIYVSWINRRAFSVVIGLGSKVVMVVALSVLPTVLISARTLTKM
jgi:hypothetical protein